MLSGIAICSPADNIAKNIETSAEYPEMVIHYHRHYTDGLFVPALGAAAEAGAHILDTALGAAVRWYGQGDVLATAAYLEEELGLETHLNNWLDSVSELKPLSKDEKTDLEKLRSLGYMR